MAIHGFKVNDAAFQKVIDNATARASRQYETIGKEVLKNNVETGIEKWYASMNSSSDGYSMKSSMSYKSKITQNKKTVDIIITAYLDEGKYNYYSSHYKIHGWNDRHGNPIDASSFVADLQWNQGILGLPAESYDGSWVNEYFNQGEPLLSVVERTIAKNFVEDMNRKI